MTSWQDFGEVSNFQENKKIVKNKVLIYQENGAFFACENKCPHMGYPMDKGQIKDGVITCAWHNWDFDLKNGGCYRGACDDLPTYPTKIENNHLMINLNKSEETIAELKIQLQENLMMGDTYLQAKSIAKLLGHHVCAKEIADVALKHCYSHSERNHQTPQACYEMMAISDARELAEMFPEKHRIGILLQGLRVAGGSTGNRPRITNLPGSKMKLSKAKKIIERYTLESSPLGIERTLKSLEEEIEEKDWYSAILNITTIPKLIAQRQNITCIASMIEIKTKSSLPSFSEQQKAIIAWVLGQRRNDANIEENNAINWLNHKQKELNDFSFIAKSTDTEEERNAINPALTEELNKVVQRDNIESIFDGLLNIIDQNTYEEILNSFSLLSARRLDRLWLNNGGMWVSATEGIRLCNSLRQIISIEGEYKIKAIFSLGFYFYQTRWLQNGKTFTKVNPTQDSKLTWRDFDKNFESAKLTEAKNTALSLIEEHGHQQLGLFAHKMCETFIKEDLNQIMLNTITACLKEQTHQTEWQPYISGLCTYIADMKLNQNIRSAAKFGHPYMTQTEKEIPS